MKITNKELEALLKNRSDAPNPSRDFSSRIIQRARSTAHEKANWLDSFLASFALPRPALTLASILLIGLGIGLFMQNTHAVDDEEFFIIYFDDIFESEDA